MQANGLTEEQIRIRAHEIYLQRGCQPGHATDDWLQAEYELMRLPIRKIAELPLPKPRKGGAHKLSVIALVHAALLLGAERISHWNG